MGANLSFCTTALPDGPSSAGSSSLTM
jgi:hypothetical protein